MEHERSQKHKSYATMLEELRCENGVFTVDAGHGKGFGRQRRDLRCKNGIFTVDAGHAKGFARQRC